jgi:hypothetical protein
LGTHYPPPSTWADLNSLRFKVTLDAQTAAMQHQGDTPVTYLNKGTVTVGLALLLASTCNNEDRGFSWSSKSLDQI